MIQPIPIRIWRVLVVLSLLLTSIVVTTAGDWPTYQHDTQRSSASDETTLSPTNVPQLTKLWQLQTTKTVAAQAIVVNGTVYVGSWDGYEYALDATSGRVKWKTFLGMTDSSACGSTTGQGITSGAAVQNGVLYLGGGDSNWYALNATTGAIMWSVPTGDNSPSAGHYNWASPLLYNGYAYVGIASNCDNPLVQGQLLKVNLSTHSISAILNLVPNGQIGAGIWTSPAVDADPSSPSYNTIYVTTGTEGQNPATQPNALAIVAIDATTLAIKGSYQVIASQHSADSDYGTSPILYTDAQGHRMVSALNKGGYVYGFDRTNISAGPVWQQVAVQQGAEPFDGDTSVSSGTFANGTIYFAGGNTVINGRVCQGAVQAFDGTTGAIVWQQCAPGVIMSPIAYANGFIIDGVANYVEVRSAATGARLFDYKVCSGNGGAIYNLSIANGQIYTSATCGNVVALGLPNPPPAPTATALPDASCPTGWSCQDIGAPAPVGSDFFAAGTYIVQGGGADIGGTADQFRFMAQPVSGDTQISAQITAQSNTNAAAKAGLMVRASLSPGAPYYAAFLTPGNGLVVQYRLDPAGTTTTAVTNMGTASPPLYLQIVRSADGFVAATSSDGVHYTLVAGSQALILLPGTALAGLAVSSHNTTALSSAAFSSVALGGPAAAPATPTAVADAGCPSGWLCGDTGSFVPSGSETLASGTWTLNAAGQDQGGLFQLYKVGSNYDEFHYVGKLINGNGSVSARVVAQTGTNAWAKAGVILRGSQDPAAPYFAAYLTPGNGAVVEYRLAQGYFHRTANKISGAPPLYLKVQRSGGTFTAYTSTNGTTWSLIPGSTTPATLRPPITMGTTMLAALVSTSYTPGVLNTAQFDSVQFTGATVVPTNTPTSTPTTVPTNTPTNTPTSTPTGTPTNTPTSTPTGTATSTPTGTATSTPTNTPMSTATDTPTSTPTSTAPAVPPDPPTNVSASAGDSQATLSWSAPQNNGGSPITDYRVYGSDGSVLDTLSTATSAVVPNLVNGQTYTFTVTAINVAGEGLPSAASNTVVPAPAATNTPTSTPTNTPMSTATDTPTSTPTSTAPAVPPDPPTNVSASAGDSQATLSWSAPQNNGGSPITDYRVYGSDGSVLDTLSTATSAVVPNLVNGQTYTFTVTAVNAAGEGLPSDPSNAVVPAPAATSTSTTTPTSTPTNTPTNTPTSTPTNTSTNTPTSTRTNTPTNTPTSTRTNTPTNTPTSTPTNTPSQPAAIVVNPTLARYQDMVTITGTAFGVSEPVNIYLDTTVSTPLTSTTTTATGSFVAQYTVTEAVTATHSILAVGQNSGLTANAALKIRPKAIALHYSTTANATNSISGYGFAAGEVVKLYWASGTGPMVGASTTNTLGSFAGAGAITFTTPLSPTGTYPIYAVGQTSGGVTWSNVTLGPALQLSPTSGARGSSTLVSGNGYGANEQVTLAWNCSARPCTGNTVLGTALTNANGAFTFSATIPTTATVGVYYPIGVTGATSGAFAKFSYKVTS